MGGAPTSSSKSRQQSNAHYFCADSANTAKMEDANCKQWHEINKNADWMKIQDAVTKLFQLRRFPELATELPVLNEKLTMLSQSEIGQFIGEFYQEHILKKCMIILRQELVDEKGSALLQKLAEIWTQFYTSILPTLQAIFIPVQSKQQRIKIPLLDVIFTCQWNHLILFTQLKFLSVRSLTLISFRDVVLLKTDIADALETESSPPPQIRQMLLVLQSVRRTPPVEQFYTLQTLVGKVVHPYLCMVHRSRPGEPPKRTSRAETMTADIESSPPQRQNSTVKRRHSLGNIQDPSEPS